MFPSLPPVLKRTISDFSEAKDVLALASTCQVMHRDLSISVLLPSFEVLYGKLYVGTPTSLMQPVLIRQGEAIPIFLARHCHSVRLTCTLQNRDTARNTGRDPGKLFVVSRPKQDRNGDKTTENHLYDPLWILDDRGNRGRIIVWQSDSHRSKIDTTFRYDPTQNYFIWYQCEGNGNFIVVEHLKVDRLLIWDDSSRNLKCTYAKCVKFDARIRFTGEPFAYHDDQGGLMCCDSPGHQTSEHSFLAKLFALALETIDLEDDVNRSSWQSIIKTFFVESQDTADGTCLREMDGVLLMALKRMADLYLQLVEQEHAEETSSHIREVLKIAKLADCSTTDSQLVTLPPMLLLEKLESRTAPKELPRFVTRIPVLSGAKQFRLMASVDGMSADTFLLFAKMSPDSFVRSDPDRWLPCAVALNTRNDFHLIWQMSPNDTLDSTFDVFPDVEAYYLYIVREESSQGEFESLEVQLSMVQDEYEGSIMDVVVERFSGLLGLNSDDDESNANFHLGLLRAVAKSLRMYKEELSSGGSLMIRNAEALTELLASEGFPTADAQGLDCVAQLSDEMLQYRSGEWSRDLMETEGDMESMLFRTHAAM